MAYHSALPCCLPAVLSRLICSQRFLSGEKRSPELQRRIAVDAVYPRCSITRKRIWKALRWRQTSSLATVTAGNFLCCPPLPISCQAINSQSGDERWQQGYWAPILDLYVNDWQNDRSLSFGYLEKGMSWEADKPPLLNTCQHCRLRHDSSGCRQRTLLRGGIIRGASVRLQSHFPGHFLTNGVGMTDRDHSRD